METRANHVLIGAFTLAVLIGSFLFILWIGKLSIAREWDFYDIIFEEAVTGLTVGGAVQINGIQVGEVRKLSLDPNNPSKVIARVRVVGDTPIKTDTKAKLAFTGLTGVCIIQLTGGTQNAPRVTLQEGQEVPRIIAETSALQKLLNSSEDIVTVVNDLLVRLSKALNQENLDKAAGIIDHLEKVSSQLANHDQDIGAALADLAVASKSLRATLDHSEQLVVKLDALATSGDKLFNGEAKQALASAHESLDAIKKFADNANSILEHNRDGLNHFSSQGLSQVGPALNDLRSAVKTLRELSDQLKDDPSSLLRGKKEQPRERDPR